MVKHIILWNLRSELSEAEKKHIKANIKENLEGLLGNIEGLTDIKVYTEGLSSSTCDLMLYSVFESEEALSGYSVHPKHQAVANTFVRPYTERRTCLDFED